MPKFWRDKIEKVAKKYSVKAIRDSYYFFRWNKENQSVWKSLMAIGLKLNILVVYQRILIKFTQGWSSR